MVLAMVYSQRFPSFWTGTNHTNENSNVLFENIPIDKNTSEFEFVQRMFTKTVSESQFKIAFVSLYLSIDFNEIILDLDRTYSKCSSLGKISYTSFVHAEKKW